MSVHWLEEVFGAEDEVFFIQVGSNVGASIHDPVYPLIKDFRAYGILVEPLPQLFAELVGNYAAYPDLEFENVAVSEREGTMELHFLDFERNDFSALPDWSGGLASSDSRHARSHFPEPAENLVFSSAEVECTTLSALCRKHGVSTLDLLHVDAEGHELEVLRSLDYERVRPNAILWESRHADGPFTKGERYRSCLDFLAQEGYRLVRENEHDSFCVLT